MEGERTVALFLSFYQPLTEQRKSKEKGAKLSKFRLPPGRFDMCDTCRPHAVAGSLATQARVP